MSMTNSDRKKMEKALKSIVKEFGRSGTSTDKKCNTEIKLVLAKYFPKDEISFPIVSFSSDCPVALVLQKSSEPSHIFTPAKAANGELTLYSKIFECRIGKSTADSIHSFWQSFLKDMPDNQMTTRDMLFLAKWIDSKDVNMCCVTKKGPGFKEGFVSFWTQGAQTKWYIPDNMDKKDLFSHMLVTGRLPSLKEARMFISKNNHSDTELTRD